MSSQTLQTPRLPVICEGCLGHGVIRTPVPDTERGSVVALLRCGACLGHGVEVRPQDRDFTVAFTV